MGVSSKDSLTLNIATYKRMAYAQQYPSGSITTSIPSKVLDFFFKEESSAQIFDRDALKMRKETSEGVRAS